ncbi:hypothetical protein [Arenimonas caeni]|uniref:HD/PDEase domain-containing protein n=1 Tax=Arenimonas caeni TaxID=2058085 RepID=A0A2P6M5K1_9GAMM|nr:hypothetical protein [Arenimonas caeni]PRH81280.1 hypothetical protein C6N40_13460 [Arenimonas caeni]
MFNSKRVAPAALKFPAVVEVISDPDPNHGVRCRLYSSCDWREAWTWLPLDTTLYGPLLWGVATTLEIGRPSEDLLLVDLHQDADLPLSNLLPEQLCPIPGLVRQTTRLIDGLQHAALREFITRALLQPDVLHGYWNSPASRGNHHGYPGGLAQHSLEIATMVASVDPEWLKERDWHQDRELGIVFALLHDYGKIWCYDPIAFEPVDSREHEALGLLKLEEPLRILTQQDRNLGIQMRELLSGRQTQRKGPYPLAINKVVRAFDQFSCEMTRKPKAESRATFDCDIPF